MFFEGSEKKVELILSEDGPSLRSDRERWERVVAASNATILSSISNDVFDAYLLSESSLFVYDRSLIMITCGTTSLARAVIVMLEFIAIEEIQLLTYERKNEYFPEAQLTDFDEDVARLNAHVPGTMRVLGNSRGNHVHLFHSCKNFTPPQNDMTLEILMHGISGVARELFNKPGLKRAELYEKTAINQIFKNFQCDDFVFDPVGYSLNAIGGDSYYTFHVTPEDGHSYASFETNYTFSSDPRETIQKVVDIFKPESFTLVFFDQHGLVLPDSLTGYSSDDHMVEDACGYDIRYRNFSRD